jgi:hypothetical protein
VPIVAAQTITTQSFVTTLTVADAVGFGNQMPLVNACSPSGAVIVNAIEAGGPPGVQDQIGGLIHWLKNAADGIQQGSITLVNMVGVTRLDVKISSMQSKEQFNNFSIPPDIVTPNGTGVVWNGTDLFGACVTTGDTGDAADMVWLTTNPNFVVSFNAFDTDGLCAPDPQRQNFYVEELTVYQEC